MTQNRPFADRYIDDIADLVVALRSAQDCATKRLSRSGHEFVVAKHTGQTQTELEGVLELLWIAGPRTITQPQVEKLRTSAQAIDASHACIITIGDGRVEPQLDADIAHWSGTDLEATLEDVGLGDRIPTGGAESAGDPTTQQTDQHSSNASQSTREHSPTRWDGTTERVRESPVNAGWDATSWATVALGAMPETTWPGWDATTEL